MNNTQSVYRISSKKELKNLMNELTEPLSKAFFNDPYYVYIIPNENKRKKQIKWWMEILLKYCWKNGEIYVTSDKKGVSMWSGPESPTLDNMQLALLGMIFYPFKIGFKNFLKMLDVSTQWERQHKKQNNNHYYLVVIGVDPDCQRQGLGGSFNERGS